MEDNKKRKLNIVFADGNTDQSVIKFLKNLYDITVIENQTEKSDKNKKTGIKTPDLIVFTGGEDVDPTLYNEKKGKFTNSNPSRDIVEKLKFDSNMFSGIPKLGICRGAQFLTVMNGGKLIQHVKGHTNTSHNIQLYSGSILVLPSDHHQMMYPFDMDKNSYELIGWSERHLSTIYLDGDNKNMKLEFPFYEPEIIYYNNTNSFCVQAHPEWDCGSESSDRILMIMDKYLFNSKILKKEINIDFNIDEEHDHNDYSYLSSADSDKESWDNNSENLTIPMSKIEKPRKKINKPLSFYDDVSDFNTTSFETVNNSENYNSELISDVFLEKTTGHSNEPTTISLEQLEQLKKTTDTLIMPSYDEFYNSLLKIKKYE